MSLITGQTELFCLKAKDTSLQEGKIYTLKTIGQKCGYYFISLENEGYENKWFSLDRFAVIDQVNISELTNLLLN